MSDEPKRGGDPPVVSRTLTIVNRRGLHARAAARFVKEVAKYSAKVTVGKNGTEVSGLSIVGLMMLAASQGSQVRITARGADAAQAVEALDRLVNARFEEDE